MRRDFYRSAREALETRQRNRPGSFASASAAHTRTAKPSLRAGRSTRPAQRPQHNTRARALADLREVRETVAREKERQEQTGAALPSSALCREDCRGAAQRRPASSCRIAAGYAQTATTRSTRMRPSSAPHKRDVWSAVAAATEAAAAAAAAAMVASSATADAPRTVYRGIHRNGVSAAAKRPCSAPPSNRRNGGNRGCKIRAPAVEPTRFVSMPFPESRAARGTQASACPVPLRLSDLSAATLQPHGWRRSSASISLVRQRQPSVPPPAAIKPAQRRFNGRLACAVGVESDKDQEAQKKKLYRPRFVQGLPAAPALSSSVAVDASCRWVVASARTLQQKMARRCDTEKTWLDPAHGLSM